VRPSYSTDREKLLSSNGGRSSFLSSQPGSSNMKIGSESLAERQLTTNAGGEALLRFHRKISFIKESYNTSEDENQRRFAPDAAAGQPLF
jgi:hypothetical protein